MFSRLEIAKTAACWIAGGGAAAIAKQIIENNIDAPETLMDKIKVTAGTVVMCSMIGKQVSDYTSDKFDDCTAMFNTLQEQRNAVTE